MMDIKKCLYLFFLIFGIHHQAISQKCFFKGTNDNWNSAFVGTGITGRDIMASASGSKGIYCLTQDYQTTKFGGQTTNIVVNLWDGKTWQSIGPSFPFTGTTCNLIGMEMVGDTMLIICGRFASASLGSPNIVKLNLLTQKYEAIGLGVTNGYVQRSKVYKDTMYILGFFTQVKDAKKTLTANYVARYYFKTNTWDTLENGLGTFTPNISNNVNFETYSQIEIKPDGEVFFSGDFTKAGKVACGGIASWKTGRGWHGLFEGGPRNYTGTTKVKPRVHTMFYSVKDTAMYITGDIGYVTNPPTGKAGLRRFAIYRDTSWTKVKEDTSKWNYDSAWNYNIPGMGDFYGVTNYYDPSAHQIYYGSTQSIQFKTGIVLIYDIATKKFLVPNKGVSGTRITGIQKWDNKIFAVGNFVEVDSLLRVENIAFYEKNIVNNTASWKVLGNGLSGLTNTKSINAFAQDSKGNLIVAGEFDYAEGRFCKGLAQIDTGFNISPINAKLFSVVASGNKVLVKDILTTTDTFYVVGYFAGADGIFSYGIIGFSQSNKNWFRLGSSGISTYSNVNTIVKFDNKIVIGGYFSSVGGVSASNLAYWDGSSWNAMGNPDGEVTKLDLLNDTTLVVSGTFTRINSVNVRFLGTYTKSGKWTQVGKSGLYSTFEHMSVNRKTQEIWIGYNGSIDQYSGKGSSSSFNASGYAVYKDSTWKDYGKLFGYISEQTNITHDTSGTTYLNGTFEGVNSDSAKNSLRYIPNSGWAGLGKGANTNAYSKYPQVKDAIVWNKHLVIGGIFENTAKNQVSLNLAAYKLDNASNATVSVSLGRDTSAYYGYSLFATINGSYDSLIWSNGVKNVNYTNIFESKNYMITAYNMGCLVKDTAYITIKGKNIYTGGKGDGFTSDIYSQKATMPGGKGDGFASVVYAQKATMQGGKGDGFTSGLYAQKATMPGGKGDGFAADIYAQKALMPGGKGDGFAADIYAQKALMPGGQGDGFALDVYAQKAIMPGGKGDGFASEIVTDHKTIFKGGKGDGFAMAMYEALPDGTIRKIISPLQFEGKDSMVLSTWVHNLGDYPIYGFNVNWFVSGKLYTAETLAKDSILPSDSMLVTAKKKFMPNFSTLPLDMCVLVSNIPKEKDTSNNQLCYILDKKASVAINQNLTFDLNVYPNPSRDVAWLAITADDLMESNFQLFNSEGVSILSHDLSPTTTKIEIDLRNISAGIYHFVYTRGAQNITGKLAVVR